MERSTSGGNPNQKVDSGSIWVAWASSPSMRASMNPSTGTWVVIWSSVEGRLNHQSLYGDFKPRSWNAWCRPSMRLRDQSV